MGTEVPPTPYDVVRYPGRAYADTHPDHLAATATFYGATPASPVCCRVLEVGCGDGGNLVPMAYGLPGSVFLGIDLACEAVQAARDFARRAGVSNVTFEAVDLAQFPKSAGAFDYIIAHGLYSWVPADVRDALMALVSRHLAPQGVAFVSYNTYPGCHLRRMLWEMLKFHTEELDDPQARLAEAQMLVRLVAHGSADPDEYTHPLVLEAQRLEGRLPALLYHDDLAAINDPVYFHEFADHAARHGLQFLAEAAFVSSSYAGIAREARGVLATLDPITRQQYLDFIKCRRFRETLLCRSELVVDRDESPRRMQGLTFTAAHNVRATKQDGSPATLEPSDAAVDGDAGKALLLAILATLRAAAPHALPFDTVIDRVRSRPDGEQLFKRANVDPLAAMLSSLQVGLLDPHVATPRLVFPPSDRPEASAVARVEFAKGDLVTSLWHCPVKVDDDIARRLLPLLDGTRDRGELLAAIAEPLAASGTASAAVLDEHLCRLGKLGLLIS